MWEHLYRYINIAAIMVLSTNANSQVYGIRTIDSVGLDEQLPMIAQYQPPRVYAKWLMEIADCENLPLPDSSQISKITFWAVNAETFQINSDTDKVLLGVVDPVAGKIFIALPQIWDRETVTHEFLHMLLRWKFGEKYVNQHPDKYFNRPDCYVEIKRTRRKVGGK